MVRESQKKAADKYIKEHMAVIGCKLRKEKAEEFKEYCRQKGKTPNAVLVEFINKCLDETPGQVHAAPDPAPTAQPAAAQPIPIHPKPSGSGETLEEVLARKRADRTAQQEAEAFEQRQRNPRPKKEDGTED